MSKTRATSSLPCSGSPAMASKPARWQAARRVPVWPGPGPQLPDKLPAVAVGQVNIADDGLIGLVGQPSSGLFQIVNAVNLPARRLQRRTGKRKAGRMVLDQQQLAELKGLPAHMEARIGLIGRDRRADRDAQFEGRAAGLAVADGEVTTSRSRGLAGKVQAEAMAGRGRGGAI